MIAFQAGELAEYTAVAVGTGVGLALLYEGIVRLACWLTGQPRFWRPIHVPAIDGEERS